MTDRPGQADRPREEWIPGAELRPDHKRSTLLEVITRLLFPAILVLSLYLLFAGHYRPGGGFAGALVAGLALVLRYVVAGRADVGAVRAQPRAVAGAGLLLATLTGVAPVLAGRAPLTTTVLSAELPVLGHVEVATSLLFECAVYLLVVGAVLKLLIAFGTALDAPDERR